MNLSRTIMDGIVLSILFNAVVGLFFCRAAGVCNDVSEGHQRSRKTVCHTKRAPCHAPCSVSAVPADVPVYGSQRTSCRCQRFLGSVLDRVH